MASRAQDLVKCYEGGIEDWKIDLALRGVIAMGFPEHDWDALLQDLAIEIIDFRFDPAKSNGAKESTALYSLVRHRLHGAMRTLHRRQAAAERLEARFDREDGTVRGSARSQVRDLPALRLDLRQALSLLSCDERAICEGLMAGESVGHMVGRLGWGWHRANRALARIRGQFERLGLRGYLGDVQGSAA